MLLLNPINIVIPIGLGHGIVVPIGLGQIPAVRSGGFLVPSDPAKHESCDNADSCTDQNWILHFAKTMTIDLIIPSRLLTIR
jgi:hypothetical protein